MNSELAYSILTLLCVISYPFIIIYGAYYEGQEEGQL